jgi:hypothetical protein
MTAHNDITGDAIASKPSNAYANNYDAIFRKDTMPEPTQQDRIEAKLDFLIGLLTKDLFEEEPEEQTLSLDGEPLARERDQSQAL